MMKTNIYQKDWEFWDGRTREASEREWLADCCGARARHPSRNIANNRTGILVAVGKTGCAYVGRKVQVDVVQTKNGPIAVSIRHDD